MNKTSKVAYGVLGALMAAGFGTWIYQQVGGLAVTGMNNGASWGMYICMFMLFVGLSAGGLIVASSASVFHIKQYKKVALPAIMLSTACICVAGAFILVDLGGIQRVWRMFAGPNFTSPLVWDMTVITIYLIINIVYLVNMTSGKPGADRRVEICSRFALPVAILVHTVTAWIFGLEYARAWYSSIMGPLFVASAMDSGLALLLLVLMWLKGSGRFPIPSKLVSNLAGLMVVCLCVDAYMIGCEILTAAYPGDEGAMAALGAMFSGATAPFFWFEVVAGVIIPFAILVLAKNRRNPKLVAIASVLIVLGVACKRIWLLFSSFVTPNIDYGPGVISGSTAARMASGDAVWSTTGAYSVQWPEVVIIVAVVSFGALLFLLLSDKLVPRFRSTHAEAVAQLEAEVAEEAK